MTAPASFDLAGRVAVVLDASRGIDLGGSMSAMLDRMKQQGVVLS